MKIRIKISGLLAVAAVLVLLGLSKNAYADAASYDVYDYQSENRKVTVRSWDGSGFLYLRSGPSMDYAVISKIYDGTVLDLVGSSLDSGGSFRWGNVSFDGSWGWISLTHTDYYDSSSSGDESVTRYVKVQAVDGSGYLYLRPNPVQDSNIYCNIYDGTVLKITAVRQDAGGGFSWGKTKYKGQTGWVSLKQTVVYNKSRKVDRYVKVKPADGTDFLYLRSGPGMDKEIYCKIYEGQRLHIVKEKNDAGGRFLWGKTTYKGKTGWVSLKQTKSVKKKKK